jgi:RNA polymerase sigma-54 factor
MALGLELQQRMGMQLVMTPQLQMAIRILQMSSLDLADYLQDELEKNPLLEREGDDAGVDRDQVPKNQDGGDTVTDPIQEHIKDLQAEGVIPGDVGDANKLTEELPVDADWSDIYGEASSGSNTYESVSSEAPPLDNTLVMSGTLADHLKEQLGPSAMNERERALGLMIIDAIDENGYLRTPISSLADMTGASLDEVEDVLVLVQSFDPPGVGSRTLAECLRLQLKSLKLAHAPYTDLLDHLDDLARRDFRKLGRVMKLDETALADAVDTILSLNPKPGLLYGSDHATYVVPDVFVRKYEGMWIVEVNPETVPKVRLNRDYQDNVESKVTDDEKRFLQDNATNARWLLKSLEQRSQTIYKVAQSIVGFQSEFLEKGAEYLKPLVLKDVADDVGVHESTASRVTSNKYMHTPRGIFELKYFFSSSLNSDEGDAHSSESVKFKIRKLLEDEPPRRPHSDEKLAGMLAEQGIKVARRTVAKYRESMSIPSSSRRKRLEPIK